MKKRSSRLELEIIRNQIRDKITSGKTHSQTMQELNDMPESTFYWHMAVIYKEDSKELSKQRKNLVDFEIRRTQDRLLKSIALSYQIANNSETDAKDRILALQEYRNSSIDLIRLVKDIATEGYNDRDQYADVPESITEGIKHIPTR